MLRRIRSQIGSPGLIVAIVALVAAICGTAYAATKLNGTQKKEVEKIAKKYAGKPGAPGLAGPQGAAGKNGTNGTNGSNGISAKAISFAGEKGTCKEGGIEVTSAEPTVLVCNGVKGAKGTDGISVKATSFAGEKGGCKEGGIEVKSAEPTVFVCNGEKGKEGSPWTAGGTLPPGSTETGAWSLSATEANTEGVAVSISFPIPMPVIAVTKKPTHFLNAGEEVSGECELTLENTHGEKSEIAAPGILCVWTAELGPVTNTTFEKITREPIVAKGGFANQGAYIMFSAPTGVATGAGTFAITGCTREPKTVSEPKCPEGE